MKPTLFPFMLSAFLWFNTALAVRAALVTSGGTRVIFTLCVVGATALSILWSMIALGSWINGRRKDDYVRNNPTIKGPHV